MKASEFDPDSPAARMLLEEVRCPCCRSLAVDDLSLCLGASAAGMYQCRSCSTEYVCAVIPSEDALHGVPGPPMRPTIHEPRLNERN